MLTMDQVQPRDLAPGKWTIAQYGDTPPRIAYRCACGKVNALPLEDRDAETGVMTHEVGDPDPETDLRAREPNPIECEGKACTVKDELTLVAHTEAEMKAALEGAATEPAPS